MYLRTRDWLVFTRTHSAFLTVSMTLIGALLAGTGPSPVWLAALALVAWVGHAGGFGQNNLFDLPYDRVDPSKAGQPLVRGVVGERPAWFLVTLLGYMAMVGGVLLSDPGTWRLTALAIGGFSVFGLLYNYTSKRSLLAPLWISTSYACIPLFGYWAAGGTWGLEIHYVVAYAFAQMIVQIGVWGYLKELAHPTEVNLYARLGSSARPLGGGIFEYRYSTSTVLVAWLLRLPVLVLVFAVPGLASQAGLVLFAMIAVGANHTVALLDGEWARARKVTMMVVAEIAVYWLLILSLRDALGDPWAFALITLPLAYFVAMNRVFWKRWVTPAV